LNFKPALLAFSLLIAGQTLSITPARAAQTIMPQWYHLQQDAYSLKAPERQRKLEEALAAAEKYQQPDHYPESEVLFTLGHWKQEEGDLSSAEKYLRQAVSLKQDGLNIVIAGKTVATPAAGIFLPAYSTVDSEKKGKIHALANAQSWLGRTLLSEHKYEEAAQVLNQAIVLCDQNQGDWEVILLPDTLKPYAQALRALHRGGEAEAAEKRAKEILAKRRLLLD